MLLLLLMSNSTMLMLLTLAEVLNWKNYLKKKALKKAFKIPKKVHVDVWQVFIHSNETILFFLSVEGGREGRGLQLLPGKIPLIFTARRRRRKRRERSNFFFFFFILPH